MSDPNDPQSSTAGPAGTPSEEELRAAYEAELARITAVDMIAQSAVSLLNIGARRMGPPPGQGEESGPGGRDLEQVRDAIDGARALLAILERRIPASSDRSRTPSRGCRWPTRRRWARPAHPPGSPRPASRSPPKRPPRRPASSSSPVRAGRGRPSQVAACGCPGAERGPAEARVQGLFPARQRPRDGTSPPRTIDSRRVCAG